MGRWDNSFTHTHAHTRTHTRTHTHTHTTHTHTHTPHSLSLFLLHFLGLFLPTFENWSNKITAGTSDLLLMFSLVYADLNQ